MTESSPNRRAPRIERLKVRNFRALKDVKIADLTPLTVLIGPNGSGKSTVLDVFAFLAECFESSLRKAWYRRGGAGELKTRGANGPAVVEIKYREQPETPLITYHLEVDEDDGTPFVAHEWLWWRLGRDGRPFRFLENRKGACRAIGGERPDPGDDRKPFDLNSPDMLAVNVLGQFREHARAAALRDFIAGWRLSDLSVDSMRAQPRAGPQRRLNETGSNLANVVQHLKEREPERLKRIVRLLNQRTPRLEEIRVETTPDGRALLQVKDSPFERPIPARFASDGTLKMLAYLVLLRDPKGPPFIGIEEPENSMHPRLLYELAEEYRAAGGRSQLLVATHSPLFLNVLRPEEVRVLWRDEHGHTQVERTADLRGVRAFMDNGALLGQLWTEGQFGVGDPLTRSGAPRQAP